MIANRDTLPKLPPLRPVEVVIQLRLPHKKHLKEFGSCCLEIRHDPDFSEKPIVQIVRLVDNQNGCLLISVRFLEKGLKFLLVICFVLVGKGEAEIPEKQLVEVNRRHLSVEETGNLCIGLQVFKKGTDKGRLASSNLAG